MDFYAKQLLTVAPVDFDYNCGNRWQDYPYAKGIGDGNSQGFNQLDYMGINELKHDPTSRRAVVSSLFPPVDAFKKHIPCITQLQFLIRQNKLNLIVYIRSNDMLSAWGSDAFALSQVQKYVSGKLNIPIGYLEIISVSAHIYFKRDAPELMRFRRVIY